MSTSRAENQMREHKTGNVSVWVPFEDKKLLEEKAKEMAISVSGLVRMLIKEYLGRSH